VPRLHDVATMLKLLRQMGVAAEQSGEAEATVSLDASTVTRKEAPYDLVKTMRASILVLGPLVARFGEARCRCRAAAHRHPAGRPAHQGPAGARRRDHGRARLHRRPRARLKGARITTDMVTVTGTENLLMAATSPRRDGARERRPGARDPRPRRDADRHGRADRGPRHEPDPDRGRARAARRLAPHHPDRIEAGTFLCAVAARAATVLLRGARADHVEAAIDKLREAGAAIEAGDGWIRIRADGRPRAVSFRTSEYPAFPTDMQAQFMALDAIADGAATVAETIFENRFMHVPELMRLGARIDIDGRTAMIQGVEKLSGATVMATDLRASAGLVIAGLVAEGETVVDRIYHLDRGYDRMEAKLRGLGADIERVKA
jgi:UDP-N-acetylglucosamine 1-carboxyvinyltransferase